MSITDYMAQGRAVLAARRPAPAVCRTRNCRRTGTYRCRVCGTDWCGHHGRARLAVDERVDPQWWLTSCCHRCRNDDPVRG